MKVALIMLKNDNVKGLDNRQVMEGLKQIVEESLLWWHENLGVKDSLELDKWKTEKIVVFDESDLKKIKESDSGSTSSL